MGLSPKNQRDKGSGGGRKKAKNFSFTPEKDKLESREKTCGWRGRVTGAVPKRGKTDFF
jgi:hypothetical protein